MQVRRAGAEDAEAIVRLFFDTVHRVNRRDYSPEQIRAWAPAVPDPGRWALERMPGRLTLAAEEHGQLLGFAELEASGHIDALFVHPDHQRRGVGRALLSQIEREARLRKLPRLYAEVSVTARPFFEAFGFQVREAEDVVRGGVRLKRWRMDKRTTPAE